MLCIRNYFRKKFNYESEQFPSFSDVTKEEGIDVEVEASGFTREMQKTFDEAVLGTHECDAEDENDSDEKDEDEDSEADRCGLGDTQAPSCHCSDASLEHTEYVGITDSFANLTTQTRAMQPNWDVPATVVETPTEAVVNPCAGYKPCHITDRPPNPSVDDDNESDIETADDLLDLSNQNREMRPFRDVPRSPEGKPFSRVELTNSGSEPRTKPGIDVQAVRQKIKTQHKRQQEKATARRAIKRGEAATVTRARRQDNDTIQHRAGWDF